MTAGCAETAKADPGCQRRKRRRSSVLKDEAGGVNCNFVFQDLKMKNGTKATKGAEKLRRKIKRTRNTRWREANGIRARGRRAANSRREQLAKELQHEKNISDAMIKVTDMFSSGVDIKAVMADKENEGDDNNSSQSKVPSTLACSRKDLEDFLVAEFKYDGFRAGQLDAISSVLSQQERALVVLPTGRGKSLCYQFPSVYMRKKLGYKNCLTIVVSPLIALMDDQLKQLPECCRGALLHSNLSPTQSSLVFSAISRGLVDILFVAPERLLMYSITDLLSRTCSVVLVAVDEAHCLSEWSHSFRPAYLALGKIINDQIRPRSLLALTATATQQTVSSLASVLSISKIIRTDGIGGDEETAASTVQRENLELFARRSPNPVMDVIEFLSRSENQTLGPIIVYVQYKWQTENVANVLRERGFGTAEPYHAGMSSTERKDVYSRFFSNQLRIVVATVAFGMGIDKSNLRAVIHLCVPKSIENYVQETGRCSRDGQLGYCRCFFNATDFARIRNKAESEALTKDGVANLFRRILARDQGMYGNHLMFVPETIDLVSSGHMSLILSILEKDEGLIEVFQGFPAKIKLRFFSTPMADIAPIDPFVNILFHSPCTAAPTVVERSGVSTVDLPKAISAAELTPPKFMYQLSEAARAQKFAIEKSDWGHIIFLKDLDGVVQQEVIERVYQKAIANHRLEMNRLDASFALLSRIAAETIEDEKIGHKLIQQYFAAEKRIPTGDDLVPSILEGAPPAIGRSVLREIEAIRNTPSTN